MYLMTLDREVIYISNVVCSIGSVLGLLSCLMQRHGFGPSLTLLDPVEEISSLGVNMGSHSIP